MTLVIYVTTIVMTRMTPSTSVPDNQGKITRCTISMWQYEWIRARILCGHQDFLRKDLIVLAHSI